MKRIRWMGIFILAVILGVGFFSLGRAEKRATKEEPTMPEQNIEALKEAQEETEPSAYLPKKGSQGRGIPGGSFLEPPVQITDKVSQEGKEVYFPARKPEKSTNKVVLAFRVAKPNCINDEGTIMSQGH